MVLLDAFVATRREEIAAVANVDHGTGAHATSAAELVREAALRHGLSFVHRSLAPGSAVSEDEWRRARWAFLAEATRQLDATVVTAHTRDDQIETVVQRILRGAGVRGLAAMSSKGKAPLVVKSSNYGTYGTKRGDLVATGSDSASSVDVVRPLLAVARRDIASYALEREVRFIDDPSNLSRKYQRNRVRLDLLPSLESVVPGFGDWCIDLAARARVWRTQMDSVLDALGISVTPEGAVVVPAAAVSGFSSRELAVLWPAIAARAGIAMDWRGIERVVEWSARGTLSGVIQLSGGARVERNRAGFVVRR